MKLVLLLYLEGDGPAVAKLLSDQQITAYSRLPIEGHGQGKAGGWFGDVAAHNSKMIFSIVSHEQADSLMQAVQEMPAQDASHPVHMAKLHLEAWVNSSS